MCEPAEPWPRIDAVSYGQARLKLRRRRPAVRHHDLTQSDFRIIIARGAVVVMIVCATPAGPRRSSRTGFFGPSAARAVDGSRRLNLYCAISGKPRVVPVAGAVTEVIARRFVEAVMRKFVRACTCDLAGSGSATRASVCPT